MHYKKQTNVHLPKIEELMFMAMHTHLLLLFFYGFT
jgi:hypothetical protein